MKEDSDDSLGNTIQLPKSSLRRGVSWGPDVYRSRSRSSNSEHSSHSQDAPSRQRTRSKHGRETRDVGESLPRSTKSTKSTKLSRVQSDNSGRKSPDGTQKSSTRAKKGQSTRTKKSSSTKSRNTERGPTSTALNLQYTEGGIDLENVGTKLVYETGKPAKNAIHPLLDEKMEQFFTWEELGEGPEENFTCHFEMKYSFRNTGGERNHTRAVAIAQKHRIAIDGNKNSNVDRSDGEISSNDTDPSDDAKEGAKKKGKNNQKNKKDPVLKRILFSMEGITEGWKVIRRCPGAFTCSAVEEDGSKCFVVIPAKTGVPLKRSGSEKVSCTNTTHKTELAHNTCAVCQTLIASRRGVFFMQNGKHEHPQPATTRIISTDRAQLQDFIAAHPGKTPTRLMCETAVIDGQKTMLLDINPGLMNRDRLAYECKKLRPDVGLLAYLKQLQSYAPGFVVSVELTKDGQGVVCMRTRFLTKIIKEERYTIAKNTNGFVNDAAHKFIQDTAFVISSAYRSTLHRWVPVFASLITGQGASCYEKHFHQFLTEISKTYKDLGKVFSPEDMKGMVSHVFSSSQTVLGYPRLVQVVDYSQAQLQGYFTAFANFFSEQKGFEKSGRDWVRLREQAEATAKGCRYHFETGVTRVERITSVIQRDNRNTFRGLAMRLPNCQTPSEFESVIAEILDLFPMTRGWADWWSKPSVAKLFVRAFTDMDDDTFESLPWTTNAQEAMHQALYKAVGNRFKTDTEGLEAFYKFQNMLFALDELVKGT